MAESVFPTSVRILAGRSSQWWKRAAWALIVIAVAILLRLTLLSRRRFR